ncbi:MaoC/PaaZ C-terminal domain-containing protein [Micromonospora arborensis]|uniref:MaoC/PaaZ C-terminal domain-containing protein n=1 Tax=Micromonospora arborensis TaxID=2116518 RepID=UPI0033F6814C
MTAPDARSGTGQPAELFFEDLVPGLTVDLGVVTVDGDEMVAFARRFDPQWYHVDPDLAGASRHGGLIASGFYTVSLFMRAYVDHLLSRAAADASPGLEELRWLAPVRAGDRLAVRVDVMGARPSTARPGLGTVSLTGTMLRLGPDDRPEQEVLRTRFRGWFAVRPVDPAEADPDEVDLPDTAPADAEQPVSGPADADRPVSGPTGADPTEIGPPGSDRPGSGTPRVEPHD